MSFAEAIEAQPDNLAAAAEAFRTASAELDLAALGRGTIVFAGIGASAHALVPAVLALRAAGRRAFAVQSTELAEEGVAELGDAFVLVSQSGASAETVAALERIGPAPVIAISAHAESPLVRAARAWLPLGPMADTRVSTLSYTATLQALGMLCDALLGERGVWERIPEFAARAIAVSAVIVAEIAPVFARVSSLDAVGGGAGLASAGETALLAREALRIPATGMETREYLHGPLEAVAPGFGAVVFGGRRERELAGALASYGATTALIGDEVDSPHPVAGGATVLALPAVPAVAAPILQILPAQLLVDRVAALRGLTIGELLRHQDDTKIA
jgi:glucosamine--fructose-6-phosphate aminotransferase (isomerizing)